MANALSVYQCAVLSLAPHQAFLWGVGAVGWLETRLSGGIA